MKPFETELKEISVMLVVAEIEKSEKFYNDFFGFETIENIDGLRKLHRKGFSLYLVTLSPPTPDKPNLTLENINQSGKTNVNLVFHVADCRKVYSELKEKGLKFIAEPMTPPWGGWRVFTRDPDGYLIEFEQAEDKYPV